jgi:hypothetical protein
MPSRFIVPRHLGRFQVVVLEAQKDHQLFPADWAVRDDDKAVMKMMSDGGFAPTKKDVQRASGTRQSPSTIFFLQLFHIQRASRTLHHRTSPKPRTMLHRLVRQTAWAQAFKNTVLIATPASDTDYHPSESPMSVSSLKTDLGPRETSSRPSNYKSGQIIINSSRRSAPL